MDILRRRLLIGIGATLACLGAPSVAAAPVFTTRIFVPAYGLKRITGFQGQSYGTGKRACGNALSLKVRDETFLKYPIGCGSNFTWRAHPLSEIIVRPSDLIEIEIEGEPENVIAVHLRSVDTEEGDDRMVFAYDTWLVENGDVKSYGERVVAESGVHFVSSSGDLSIRSRWDHHAANDVDPTLFGWDHPSDSIE